MGESEMLKQVARAIWNEMREQEDRGYMELEDMGEDHPVWAYARLAIAAMEEPTEEMREAGTLAIANAIATGKQFDEAWRAGVRAALHKPSSGKHRRCPRCNNAATEVQMIMCPYPFCPLFLCRGTGYEFD